VKTKLLAVLGCAAVLSFTSESFATSRAYLRVQDFREQIGAMPVEVFTATETAPGQLQWSALVSQEPFPHAGRSVPVLASENKALAATNANFYREDVPGRQEPIGLVIHDGRILSLPNKFWPSVGFLEGRLEWDNVEFIGQIHFYAGNRISKSVALCRLNVRPTPHCASLWLNGVPKNQKNLFKIKNNSPSERVGLKVGISPRYKIEAIHGGDEIIDSGWVLQLPSPVQKMSSDEITFESSLKGSRLKSKWMNVTEAVSGSHVLTPLTLNQTLFRQSWVMARQPRTLIGTDENGRGWIAVFDGRREQSHGASVLDAWKFLRRKLNAAWALNLDGGGSTTMLSNGRLVNKPSDGLPRSIAVGWGAVIPRESHE